VRKIVFRPKAKDDLVKLYHYIAERSDSPETAISYIRRIQERCDAILTFPEGGRRRDDLRPGIRIIGFERRAVIIYTILPSGDVEIGRVLYGARTMKPL